MWLKNFFKKMICHFFISYYSYTEDPRFKPYLTPEILEFTKVLREQKSLPFDKYQEMVTEILQQGNNLVIGQKEYIETHRLRFYELFNTVLFLLKDVPRPKILEFGVSEFSRLYKKLIPSVELYTADLPLPADHPGFTEERCKRIAEPVAHITIDLTKTMPHENNILSSLTFHFIVFTEVLEHLDVNPIELLASLKKLLIPGGWLYLTTPNFFSYKNLIRFFRRENPLPFYPKKGDNWDYHHHHREYEMSELLDAVTKAGLKVKAFYFSSCWDEKKDIPEELFSNLVIVSQA